jgi:hypothetical protein
LPRNPGKSTQREPNRWSLRHSTRKPLAVPGGFFWGNSETNSSKILNLSLFGGSWAAEEGRGAWRVVGQAPAEDIDAAALYPVLLRQPASCGPRPRAGGAAALLFRSGSFGPTRERSRGWRLEGEVSLGRIPYHRSADEDTTPSAPAARIAVGRDRSRVTRRPVLDRLILWQAACRQGRARHVHFKPGSGCQRCAHPVSQPAVGLAVGQR